MSCAERKELILLHAFSQLERDEAAALIAHLQTGCPTCVGELAAARTIAGMTGLATAPVAPSKAVRDRVISAALSGRAPKVRWTAYAAPALLAAGLAGLAILVPARRGIERLRAETQQARQAATASAARAAAAEDTLKAIGSPLTRVFAMGPAGPQPEASGRIFWDERNASWQIFFTHMKAPPPGRAYQLWFITPDERKVSAGTFDVGESGEATLTIKIPPGLGGIAVAAVTEEPGGGVPQPTGAIQLVAKLGT